MSTDAQRHLPKAPIIQAVLEILVEPAQGKTIKDLQNFHKNILESYPKQRKRLQGVFTMQGKEAGTVSAETKQDGFTFTSLDNLKSVIATVHQFDYLQNSPYNTWEDFIEEAKTLWREYGKQVNPVKIRRLSVRYINQINIQLPMINIAEYFLTYPYISEQLPQTVEHFFMGYTVAYKEKDIRATVMQTVGETENDKVPFLFDLDVLTTVPMENNEELIWQKFNEIRDLKNEIFFSSLTDKTIELLQ